MDNEVLDVEVLQANVDVLTSLDTDFSVETVVDGYQISEFHSNKSFVRVDVPDKLMIDDGWLFAAIEGLKLVDQKQLSEAQNNANSNRNLGYIIRDGIAYIDINGPLMKRPSCMSWLMGSDGSYTQYRAALRSAINDEKVSAVALIIDSPGGEVSGAFDLADDVYKLSNKKPIYAYAEDICASAAYLIASQSLQVWGNINLHAGSIGVYTSIVDSSKRAEDSGVTVRVIKAGKYKAAGSVPGSPVTQDQIDSLQAQVDAIQSLFVKFVSRGRQMNAEELTKVADASIHIGSSAKKVKLIDQVGTIDDFHNKIVGKKFVTSRKDSQMSADLSDVTRWLGDNTLAETTTQPEETIAAFLKQNNVKDENELKQLQEQAKFGLEQEKKIREQVAALAIVALGPDDGANAKSSIDTMPINVVQDLAKQYINIGQNKGLIGKDGVPLVRATVGNATADDGPISASANVVDKDVIVKKSAEYLISQDRAGQYLPF